MANGIEGRVLARGGGQVFIGIPHGKPVPNESDLREGEVLFPHPPLSGGAYAAILLLEDDGVMPPLPGERRSNPLTTPPAPSAPVSDERFALSIDLAAVDETLAAADRALSRSEPWVTGDGAGADFERRSTAKSTRTLAASSAASTRPTVDSAPATAAPARGTSAETTDPARRAPAAVGASPAEPARTERFSSGPVAETPSASPIENVIHRPASSPRPEAPTGQRYVFCGSSPGESRDSPTIAYALIPARDPSELAPLDQVRAFIDDAIEQAYRRDDPDRGRPADYIGSAAQDRLAGGIASTPLTSEERALVLDGMDALLGSAADGFRRIVDALS